MNQSRSPRFRENPLTESGVKFIEFDSCVEAPYQRGPCVTEDHRKDMGVEEIGDQDEF